ncbi:hypothetical protein BpHYR1_039058 [Brachionus plicatilis]|uniref:Uncharacterized protein n=1 Tax=Brachionus plicatilis TaxID=10195 RepID=A0A3M7S362_BRAPC|nr:hypothetical protein BpHYR1_039058 [Brachionus plicatilis]
MILIDIFFYLKFTLASQKISKVSFIESTVVEVWQWLECGLIDLDRVYKIVKDASLDFWAYQVTLLNIQVSSIQSNQQVFI